MTQLNELLEDDDKLNEIVKDMDEVKRSLETNTTEIFAWISSLQNASPLSYIIIIVAYICWCLSVLMTDGTWAAEAD